MTLEWRQTDEFSWITACGKYSVGFDHLIGSWRAFRMEPMGAWFAPLPSEVLEGEGEAKQICEEHAK